MSMSRMFKPISGGAFKSALLCALAYFTIELLGSGDPPLIDSFNWYWLANALLLAALLIHPAKTWPQLITAVTAAHLLTLLDADARSGGRLVSVLICNEGFVCCTAAVLLRMLRRSRTSRTWRLSLDPASVTEALGGVLVVVGAVWLLMAVGVWTAMAPASGTLIEQSFLAGSLQTVVGFAAVTPAIVSWGTVKLAPMSADKVSETALAISLVALVCVAAFFHSSPVGAPLLWFLPIITFWAGMCLSVRALTASLLASALTLQLLAQLPIGSELPARGLDSGLQLFLFATALGALALAALKVRHEVKMGAMSGRARRLRRKNERHKRMQDGDVLGPRSMLSPMHDIANPRAIRLAVIGEITAAITHEVNQPLAAILNNAETALYLMQAGKGSHAVLKEILEDIRRDDLRASNVVRRTRALLQDQELVRGPVDLNELIAGAADAMKEGASRRDITLILARTAIPLVYADSLLLQQALLNLLANAFDAVDEPGGSKVVEVFACSSAGCVQICVRDSGHGIPEPDLQRIFESFRTGKHTGLGLGLSIARAIATAHGGRVFAENNVCGTGATVRIELPLAVDRKAAVALV